VLQWTSHPARHKPADAALAVAIMALTAWAVLVSLHSALLAALSIVILLLATAAFWLPTKHIVDENGVSQRRAGRTQFRKWQDLRRYSFGSRTVLLSPFAKTNWLDRYRGVVLLLDGAPIDALRAELRQRWPINSINASTLERR
jgi:hypothetical protein